jgi:hypothetical protein
METEKINEILHRYKTRNHYSVRVGGPGVLVLGPRVPMTRYTEFVSVEPEEEGDVNSFDVQETTGYETEGVQATRTFRVVSKHPGTIQLRFVAKDRITGERIPGVQPVGVTIEATR